MTRVFGGARAPWLRQELGLILWVSLGYGFILAFLGGVGFGIAMLASDSALASALRRVNPALALIEPDLLLAAILLVSWPSAFTLVLMARRGRAGARRASF